MFYNWATGLLTETRKKKEPSPPRFPATTILHIKGLTRPFTINQLHVRSEDTYLYVVGLYVITCRPPL